MFAVSFSGVKYLRRDKKKVPAKRFFIMMCVVGMISDVEECVPRLQYYLIYDFILCNNNNKRKNNTMQSLRLMVFFKVGSLFKRYNN